MSARAATFAFVLLAAQLCFADAGVLIPTNSDQPNAKVLSLEEMSLDIRIDNGDARVTVRQIFTNHTGRILEGNYVFAVPGRATVSDFAVWDTLTRIPAVILERKRAEEIYNQLRARAIDPGLLQMGERGSEEARRAGTVFSARIVPIPAFSTKRMELEYHESIPVENLKSMYALPLRPDAYRGLAAGRLTIHFELRSAHEIKDFTVTSKSLPLTIRKQHAHEIIGDYEGTAVSFTEDFTVLYSFDTQKTDRLEVITHRNPNSPTPDAVETAPVRSAHEPGFFEASALLGYGKAGASAGATAGGPPRTLLLLFDSSLSMQWEKLERNYQALEALLRALRPEDRFNVFLFNSDVTAFSPAPVAADAVAVQKALDFVRAGRLRGGTDLELALAAALKQSSANTYLILLSDGGATRGTVHNGHLAAWYEKQWKEIPEAQRPHTRIFAVGDDANMPLVKMLARNQGTLEWVRSTEPIEFKLNNFVSRIGRNPLDSLRLTATPEAAFDMIYPLQESSYSGSQASWIGQYQPPAGKEKGVFTVRGSRDAAPLELKTMAALPAVNDEHPQLPRLWARARVDALLEKIERDGEDRASVDEIIALARKYKFVTPYTSFLAAPRTLLRPRVIKPGDPLLRVKTDESIVSVVALFPFGLVSKLRYLPQEDIWQTRFLAPTDMRDGAYPVRLVLRDRRGQVYRESKSFVIASTPPLVRVRLDKKQFHRGEVVQLRARTSESTRTVLARLEGTGAVHLYWDERAGASTGSLQIPGELPPGRYTLTVTAEDIAHNIGSQEVSIDVLP